MSLSLSLLELAALLALGALGWYWFDSLRAREVGVAAARRACVREGLQLLDETVIGRGLRCVRDERGHLTLRRVFEFEYSSSGDDRYPGAVVVESGTVVLVDVSSHYPRGRGEVIELH